MARHLLTSVTAVLVAAALGGCFGGQSEEDKVGAVVQEFVEAGNARDFARFCELLTADARKEIEKIGATLALTGDDACSRTMLARAGTEQGGASVDVTDVRISANRAAVDVSVLTPDAKRPSEQTLDLEQDDAGNWLVSSFGSG